MADELKKEETNAETTDAVESKPKSNLIKYIIFAVGGLVVIGGIAFGTAFMMKDSPNTDAEQSAEVSQPAESEKPSETHAQESSDDLESAVADASQNEDIPEMDDSEFDSKAIEKIVDNLAQLEYTPSASDIQDENQMSVEDSLEQMSWIESEKIALEKRKIELDAREKELNRLETSVDSKIIKIEQAESARTNQLAQLYDGMDSRAVAKLMMDLDDNTIVTILPRMKSKNAAQVLQLLPSKRAAALSKQMITIADK